MKWSTSKDLESNKNHVQSGESDISLIVGLNDRSCGDIKVDFDGAKWPNYQWVKKKKLKKRVRKREEKN